MSRKHLFRGTRYGLLAAVILAITFTLLVAGQGPERDSGTSPDKRTEVIEEEMPAESEADSTYFHFISANTFVPNDDSMTYNYHNHGCMYRTGGGTWTEHTLQLPQGAVIDYLRIFFFDEDVTNNALAYLAAYDGYGHTTFIATAESTGTPGQSSAGTGGFYYTVDNYAEAPSISLGYGNANTHNLRICGVRLRYQYTYPIFGLALPLVNK